MSEEGPNLETISFRAEKEKVEYLDHLIDKENVRSGPGPDKISRSDLLRGCIDDLIDELEEADEGNRNPPQMAMAD